MWFVVTFGFVLSVILVPFWSLLGPFWQVLRSPKFLIYVNILVAALLLSNILWPVSAHVRPNVLNMPKSACAVYGANFSLYKILHFDAKYAWIYVEFSKCARMSQVCKCQTWRRRWNKMQQLFKHDCMCGNVQDCASLRINNTTEENAKTINWLGIAENEQKDKVVKMRFHIQKYAKVSDLWHNFHMCKFGNVIICRWCVDLCKMCDMFCNCV